MPPRTSFSVGWPVTCRPSTRTLPAVGRISPATALSSVDFPAPLGPTTAVIWPRRAVMLTPSMMGGPPYPATSSSTSSAAPSEPAASVTGRHLPEIGVDHGLVRAKRLERAGRDDRPLGHH